jgi:hypothetical protein
MTAEKYNLSWSTGNDPPVPPPQGLIFHAGVGDGDEFFTVSIWETREAYDAFASHFKDEMSRRGFDFGTPSIFSVHHCIAPSRFNDR